jgi:hypothetical protein
LSFVVLGEKQEYRSLLNNTLQKINDITLESGQEYKYKYLFVVSKDEVGKIAEQILLK